MIQWSLLFIALLGCQWLLNEKQSVGAHESKVALYVVPVSSNIKQKSLGSSSIIKSSFVMKKKDCYEYGVLEDKGPGERVKNAYFRAYLLLYEKVFPFVRRLIIGKYKVKSGNGLVMSNGSRNGGNFQSFFAKNKEMLSPSTSNGRNDALTGIAAHIDWKNWKLLIYLAYNEYYATIKKEKMQKQPNLASSRNYVGTIPTGNTFYCTENDMKKNGFTELLAGLTLIYQISKGIEFGINCLDHHYNLWFKPSQTNFCDKENANVSLFGQIKRNDHHCRGEVAYSKNGGFAFLFGDKITWKKGYWLFLLQHYSSNFNALHGSALGKKCKGNNEQGLQVQYMHRLRSIKFIHTAEFYKNNGSNKKNSKRTPFLQYNMESQCPLFKNHRLENKYTISYQPDSPTVVTNKLQYKGAYENIEWSSTVSLATKNLQNWQESYSLGISQNIKWIRDAWTHRFHCTVFNTLKGPSLYFHTPDVRALGLTSQISGGGIRLGWIFTYKKKATELQAGYYCTYRKSNRMDWNFVHKIKFQFVCAL